VYVLRRCNGSEKSSVERPQFCNIVVIVISISFYSSRGVVPEYPGRSKGFHDEHERISSRWCEKCGRRAEDSSFDAFKSNTVK
jgi:hypothetical protein